MDRQEISKRFIRGSGIECGAFFNPFPIQPGVTVLYIDKKTRPELIAGYPEIKDHSKIPETDIVGDGNTLEFLEDNSQDFLLSSHQFEHSPCPLSALKNQLRVVKPGGIVFYAIPEKTMTFDSKREVTTFAHLVEHLRAPEDHERLVREDYADYFKGVEGVTDPALVKWKTDDCLAKNYDVHFHAFTLESLRELFTKARNHIGIDYIVEHLSQQGAECLVVLRKV